MNRKDWIKVSKAHYDEAKKQFQRSTNSKVEPEKKDDALVDGMANIALGFLAAQIAEAHKKL